MHFRIVGHAAVLSGLQAPSHCKGLAKTALLIGQNIQKILPSITLRAVTLCFGENSLGDVLPILISVTMVYRHATFQLSQMISYKAESFSSHLLSKVLMFLFCKKRWSNLNRCL